MNFDTADARRPRESPLVFDEDVVEVGLAARARDWNSLHPCRRKGRSVFFPIRLVFDGGWKTSKRKWPPTQMRQQYRCDTFVVTDEIGDGKARTRVQNALPMRLSCAPRHHSLRWPKWRP